MAQITTRDLAFQLEAQGKGYTTEFLTLSNGSTITAAAAGSGDYTVSIKPNAIGSTLPSTLIDVIPLPSGTNPIRLNQLDTSLAISNTTYLLAWIYQFGTQVLTATGDQFTHHAATFPVLRTQMGTSQAVPLLPLIQITTATTTTAAVLTMKTAAGGTGYVDQDGNNVVGTLTHTMPNVATAVNSCYFLPLEDGDRGVQNVAAIQTNTAAAAGAATIWGVEPIAFLGGQPGVGLEAFFDGIYGQLSLKNLRPAVATSGTANAKLVFMTFSGTTANVNVNGHVSAIADT